MEVNLFGPWRMILAFARHLPYGGRVVNVSSGAGSFGGTAGSGGATAYSVTKAARNMLTVTLTDDLRHHEAYSGERV